MSEIKILEDMARCTGCGACVNICPKNAISMHEGYRTFFYPVIDNQLCIRCGKCINVCPVNRFENGNTLFPNSFAVKAKDSIREISSSGGFFTVAAEYILSQGGVVYGAAFDNNHRVTHIRVVDEAGVDRCRGSKYVQSFIGDTYKNVKKDLVDGLQVLFTGCPCQTAGLKNFLGKEYDNLVIADLVCHGVPSQVCFDMYLKEKSQGICVDNVLFRDKKFGWRADVTEIVFSDGTKYVKSLVSGDEWQKGFQNNYILRDSCERCKFCEYPRTGDITFGDFWGVEQFIPNDGKGTSLIFANNNKGNAFLEKIKDKFAFFSLIAKERVSFKNRLYNFYQHNKNKSLFFELLNHNTFCKSIRYAEMGKRDIAIVGIPTVENFGGALTYLALFNIVKDHGYSCVMVERPLDSPHPPTRLANIYNKSPYNNEDIIENIKSRKELSAVADIADKYLVGSDQLYSPVLMRNFQRYALLDWVPDNKLKVAYAASFGPDNIQATREDTAEISYYLKKFDSFSVREESAVEIALKQFGLNATHVLDPIFLCNRNIFYDLSANAKLNYDGDYIGGYILDPDMIKATNLAVLKEKTGMPLRIFSEMFYNNNTIRNKWNLPIEIGKIEDRLLCIKNSKLFVTDSFHGMCVALLFEKDFIVILNRNRGANRFLSVLSELNLESRIVEPEEDIYDAYMTKSPINYVAVNAKLSDLIKSSSEWLFNSLADSKIKAFSDYDILVHKLKIENKALVEHIHLLEKCLGLKYCFQTDLLLYLDELILNSAHTIVLIAAKDTPGMSISPQLMEKLYALGIKINLTDKHWCGFISAIYSHINVVEKCLYDKTVVDSLLVGGINIKLRSSPLHDGNTAEIIINGKNYAVNSRGLNFVVYDLRYGMVVDSCGFDTHTYRWLCTRKQDN